jgi:hypothetical protein
METVLVYPKEEEDVKTLKKVLKVLNFKFEVSPYKQEFVSKVKKSSKEIEKGEVITVDPKNPWQSILSK